jgi:STE24 endopeptidase
VCSAAPDTVLLAFAFLLKPDDNLQYEHDSMITVAQPLPINDTPEALRYNRIRRWLGIGDFLLGLVFLVGVLETGWSGKLRDIAYRGTGQNYVLAVILYVLILVLGAKLFGLGLEYYAFRLEHRFHLSNQKLLPWLWDELKDFLVGAAIACIVVELLYFMIRQFSELWWLLAWASFLALFVLLAQLAPVVLFPIFYKFEPLEDEDLKRRLVVLTTRAGTRVRGVYRWKLSEKSRKANAALTGLGNTRRIILADTLLEHYSPDEIEAVLAHEIGHHVHKHIVKGIVVQAMVTFAGFWAANWVLHLAVDRFHLFETLSDFANLPLLVLVSTVLSFLLMPVLNAYSRYNERQADRYAFESIGYVEPFVTAMNRLAEQNLAERHPSWWVEWIFLSHPSVARRIAAAEAWAWANQGTRRGNMLGI